MSYFLIEHGKEAGPYDLLQLIKRIRNGKLRPNDRVRSEDRNEPMLAMSLPELAPYFAEAPADNNAPEHLTEEAPPYIAPRPDPYAAAQTPPPPPQAQPQAHATGKQKASSGNPRFDSSPTANDIDVRTRMKDAWVFFGDNQTVSIIAGALTLGAIAINLVLSVILPDFIGAMVGCASAVAVLYALIIFMHCRIEGEQVDQQTIKQLATVRGADLAMTATLASLPVGLSAALGVLVHPLAYLLMIPASISVVYGIFAPLLLVTNLNFRAFSALAYSREWVRSHGTKAATELLGLLGLNLAAALCLFVPFFITLPLSAIVYADIFRDRIAPALPATPDE